MGLATIDWVILVLYVLIMLGFSLPYMAIQPIGAGKIVHAITDGQVPESLSVSNGKL